MKINTPLEVRALRKEYDQIRYDLFSPKKTSEQEFEKLWKRFHQLQAFFYPSLRWNGWKSPLKLHQKTKQMMRGK